MSIVACLAVLASALGSGLIASASPTWLPPPIDIADMTPTMSPISDPTVGVPIAQEPSNNNNNNILVESNDNETDLNERQETGLAVWVTHWFPSPMCTDGVCTQTSTDDLPHIQINGEGFTIGGQVYGAIYNWPSNSRSWGRNTTALSWPGWRGGSFGLETPFIDCGALDTSQDANSYAAAYNWRTETWSPIVWLYTGCAVL